MNKNLDTISAADFMKQYQEAVLDLQNDICHMSATPVVSLAHEAIKKRIRIEDNVQ